jgi:eukaryotic-like serine/threonine-protein kinase
LLGLLIELLSGAPAFAGLRRLGELRAAKRSIAGLLAGGLPEEVVRNELLMSLIAGLIAPDPADRFPSAEAADLVEKGAASFHRQLVKGDLASEYGNEIRVWLEGLE